MAAKVVKNSVLVVLLVSVFGPDVGGLVGGNARDSTGGTARHDSRPENASPPLASSKDGLGDPLPPGAVQRLGTQRLHHGGAVNALVWAPDGKWVASGGGFSDRSVRLWDGVTGQEIRQFQKHLSGIRAIALTGDGKTLASQDQSGWVYFWDPATGKEFRGLRTGTGLAYPTLAFGPKGDTLAALNQAGRLCLYEVATGKPLRVFAEEQAVLCVTWSADGKTLASLDKNYNLLLFDPLSGKLLHKVSGRGLVKGMAFAPDGRTLATCGQGITLWDVAHGKQMRRLEGHPDLVNSLSWSPDSKTLASASDDLTVRLWDAATGRELLVFRGHQRAVACVAFAPDGKRLASGGVDWENTVRIWDAVTGKEISPQAGHNGWVGILSPLPDGKTLITAGSDRMICRWDLATGKTMDRVFGHQGRGKAFAVAPGGKLAATGTPEGTIRVLELPAVRLVREIKAHRGSAHTLAFSPDGKTLASAGNQDGTLRLWDVASGRPLQRLGANAEVFLWLTFSADGKRLFAASAQGAIRIWDLLSGKEVRTLSGHGGTIEQLVLSPDEKLLASVGNDGIGRVWDLDAGQVVRTLDDVDLGYCVTFSTDGRTIATGSGDRIIRLWETATGKERLRLQGHRGAIAYVTFFPDDKTLLSGSSDGTVLRWDLAACGRGSAGPPKRLASDELEAEWRHFFGDDASHAYRALWVLAGVPHQAMPLLRKELQPAPIVEPKRVARWIVGLGDERFAVRDKATSELLKVGEPAWPYLRKLLENPPSAEVAARARRLLGEPDILLPTAKRLRVLRALELLERMGSFEARAFLEMLAQGSPDAWLTRESRTTLSRLAAARRETPARVNGQR